METTSTLAGSLHPYTVNSNNCYSHPKGFTWKQKLSKIHHVRKKGPICTLHHCVPPSRCLSQAWTWVMVAPGVHKDPRKVRVLWVTRGPASKQQQRKPGPRREAAQETGAERTG